MKLIIIGIVLIMSGASCLFISRVPDSISGVVIGLGIGTVICGGVSILLDRFINKI